MKKNQKHEMADVQVRDMVIFKSGMWNGETFTDADLDNMAANFNAEEGIPIIVGHSSDYPGKTRIPVFGRIMKGLKRVGSDLVAMGVEFNDKLVGWIREGYYPDRSIELSKDNKRIYALSVIGATPPAVKGLPDNDDALRGVALSFAADGDAKVIEFAEGDLPKMDLAALDKAEELAVADTLKNVSEYCARFLSDVEEGFKVGKDAEFMMKRTWDLQMELSDCLGLHGAFMRKLESIEEDAEEYAGKAPAWKSIVQRFKKMFNSQKESDMDAKEKQAYEEKVTGLAAQVTTLEGQLKEFTDAKAKAEADAVQAAEDAKIAAITQSVKEFCDKAVEEGRMTPAMRGDAEHPADEKLMVDLGKTSPEALKSFQEKYSKPIIPTGVQEGLDSKNIPSDQRPQVMQKAEKYAVAHAKDKEFAGLSKADATNRAYYLFSMGHIKFEGN